MSTPETPDPTVQQRGQALRAEHVPVPAGGVRGVDQVDAMDAERGHGTTTGADGDTAAREQLRQDLGERGPGNEGDGALEQTAALGATDHPQGGSIQEDGADPTP